MAPFIKIDQLVTAKFSWGKRFCSWTRQNSLNFGRDWKVVFKKSFKLYCQIWLKGLTKVGINFLHFAWTKVSKMKPRVNIIGLFSYQPSKLRKYLRKFCSLSEVENILQNLAKYLSILQLFMIINKIALYKTKFNGINWNLMVLNDIKWQFRPSSFLYVSF